MAITSFGPVFFPRPVTTSINNAPTVPGSTFTLNASGDKVGFVIQIPKSGTLEWFEFRVGTVSNNPDNGVRFSFQDIDLTTGLPDGGVDQFAVHAAAIVTGEWIAPDNAMTNTGAGGGVKRTVTQGEFLSCVIDFSSFVASDSFSVSANTGGASNSPTTPYYIADGSTGTYSKNSALPLLALKYDDGTYAIYAYNMFPAVDIASVAFGSSSTPDEYALRFQVSISCQILGLWLFGSLAGDIDIELLDNSNNVLTSIAFDKELRNGTLGNHFLFFSSSITIDANTTYRLTFRPSTVSPITVYVMEVDANAVLGACDGGIEMYLSTRTNAGAWTDTDTKRVLCGLIIDGFETGGGGGGEHSAVF